MSIKKNISLIVGIAIPIVMILFVAGSIYLPGLFSHPQYDFLYETGSGDYYYGRGQYSVQTARLVKNEFPPSNDPYRQPPADAKLFVYDVRENKSTEVSFEAAQQLMLDSSPKSPDSFEVVSGSRDGDFFPFMFYNERDYNARYLKGHAASKKLDLQLSGSYYDNFHFLGWIKK